MTTWVDKSDSKSLFFDGGELHNGRAVDALVNLFNCVRTKILRSEFACEFDFVILEVNCDTGRILVAVTTQEKHLKGEADACSLRTQEIQDFWYDFLENEPTDSEFSEGITKYIHDIGLSFRELITSHQQELKQTCSQQGFTYRVYGSDPGVKVYEEKFSVKTFPR